jgi:hypothetical protein
VIPARFGHDRVLHFLARQRAPHTFGPQSLEIV